MNISIRGLDLIKEFEGFSATCYKDAVGLNTIGYGTLIDTKEEQYLLTATITKEEATELIRKDLKHVEDFVNKLNLKINQSMYDSILVLCYNIGCNAFKNSTILKKIVVNPNDTTIRTSWLQWNKAGGKALKGLTRRREAEVALYFS